VEEEKIVVFLAGRSRKKSIIAKPHHHEIANWMASSRID